MKVDVCECVMSAAEVEGTVRKLEILEINANLYFIEKNGKIK